MVKPVDPLTTPAISLLAVLVTVKDASVILPVTFIDAPIKVNAS